MRSAAAPPATTVRNVAAADHDPLRGVASPEQQFVRDGLFFDPSADTPPLSAAFLTTLFMHLPYGVIVVDTTGRVVLMNEVGNHLSSEMALGNSPEAGVWPEGVGGSPSATIKARLASALVGDMVPDVDYVLGALGDTHHRVVQQAIVPVRDARAQITGVMLTLTDLTERVDIQATLVRTADALAQVTRETLAREAGFLARKAIAQARDNRDLTRSNTQLEQQATLTRVADALAKGIRETLAREASALARKAVAQAQDNRDLTQSNTELEQQATLARAAEALAQITRETLARDASTLAEHAVTQANDNRDLTRLNSGLEQFASVASHDLQEPLRKIQAFGDRLKSVDGDALSPAGTDYLERMQHAAARMQILINDLLIYARVSSGAPSMETVNLAAVTRAVLTDLETQVALCGGRVEVGLLPSIEGDPLRLRQLLQNLISNALKFRHQEVAPVVVVSAELLSQEDMDDLGCTADAVSTTWLRLTVQDNGIGFEQKHAEQIFEVFKRLHGRGAYEGTGVGLALCRQIAEQHGGRINATGTPGEGATFRVMLPINQARGRGRL